jgi:hypothetical protein
VPLAPPDEPPPLAAPPVAASPPLPVAAPLPVALPVPVVPPLVVPPLPVALPVLDEPPLFVAPPVAVEEEPDGASDDSEQAGMHSVASTPSGASEKRRSMAKVSAMARALCKKVR